jgi:predicted metal-dependent TIM-barrel fold hydrolase
MKLFDPRLHPAPLDDRDLETLRQFGLAGALLVADGTAHPATAAGLRKHFDALLERELPRFERAGLAVRVALGVHPASLPRRGLEEVLAALPAYFATGKVAALGQLGLLRGDEAEIEALLEQLALADEYRLAALVSAPARDTERLTRRLLSVLRDANVLPGRVLIDGATGRTVRGILELGFHAGLTLHPAFVSVERAVTLVRALGPERLVLDSAAGDGASDILSLARAAHRLRAAKLSGSVIARVTGRTAAALLGVGPF